MDERLLIVGALGALCAAAFAYVGARLTSRQLLPEHALAGRAFAWAWIGAAGYSGATAVLSISAGLGLDAPRLAFGVAWITVLMGGAMCAGLSAYTAHLIFGSPRAAPFAIAGNAILLMIVVTSLALLHPTGAVSTGWTARFVFERADRVMNGLIALVFLLPALLIVAGYLAAYPKAVTPTARWRIALVGGGLALWTIVAIVVRLPSAPESLLAASRAAGAFAALAVFMAYTPPAWAQRRLHVESLGDEIARVARIDPAASERDAAMSQRLRDLV